MTTGINSQQYHVKSELSGLEFGWQTGLFEIGQRLAVAPFVDLDGNQFAAGLAEGPGHPDRRVASGGSDLDSFLVIVLNYQFSFPPWRG